MREGLIDLDRPVAEHVAFTDDLATRAVTPRHLLSHSSGFPNWRDEAGEALTSAFAPGTGFRYSGEGFVLLGRLVEAVTGLTVAQVVEARVLRPAEMRRSTYGWARGAEPVVARAHDGSGAVLADKDPAGYATRRDADDALAETRAIYRASASGEGDPNGRRARLIKRMLAGYPAAAPAGSRVLMKFGDVHAAKGVNALRRRDLGNFVAERADGEGASSLHILVMGIEGSLGAYNGVGRPTPDMPTGWRQLVQAYDLIVVAPKLTPAFLLGAE